MTIKLGVKQLRFGLPENMLDYHCQIMQENTVQIRKLARKSGTGSEKFKQAYQRFLRVLRHSGDISQVLAEPVDLRALAIALKTSDALNIRLDAELFRRVDSVRSRPSSLLLESVYSHYLNQYDRLDDLESVESWLYKSKKARGELDHNTAQILGGEGPKWLAETCHAQQTNFSSHVDQVGLGHYVSGHFLKTAKNIYYLETLRQLEKDEEHELLNEVQKREVFESRYDEASLLGHEILRILISKADAGQISDHWMNVVMAIAGDPRVSTRNEHYIRWWSQISNNLIEKVRGWLSKLDLKLFLEALQDFSNQPGKSDLKRMYPSRKQFLEGLLDQKLVTGTRLFLTHEAESYIKRHYKSEHLPSYSIVEGASAKPLVYISLSGVHVVEGTHSCYFWVYNWLPDSAEFFNYERYKFTYAELTVGMNRKIWKEYGVHCYASITHHSNWQAQAAIALKKLGVNIDASMLLTKADYQRYKYSGHL